VLYREFRPTAALATVVDRLWWLEGHSTEIGADPIPPDGCSEIVVHGGDPFLERAGGGSWTRQARLLVVGPSTRASCVRPDGWVRVVGARLHPHAARRFTGLPAYELTDRILALGDVAPRLEASLALDVADLDDGRRMVAALDAALARAMPGPPESRSAAAVAIARAERGLCRVDDLAQRLGVSAREIERTFREHVGLSPKLFLRIVRFQEVLGALAKGTPDGAWASLAAEHGFYDQAHLIRDFKSFAGASPGAWRADPAGLAAVFSALGRGAGDEARSIDVTA
jgi:AraC-like DNA-binding protein